MSGLTTDRDVPQTRRVISAAAATPGEMVPPLPLRRVAVAALLVVLVTPAVAAPPPEPLCGPCDGFEAAAADEGVGVALERATATVTLARNGSATWTVRLRVDETAARTFADDPELRRAVVTEAIAAAGLPSVTEPVGLSTSVSDDTVVVRFRDPDAADREAGLLVADFLRTDGQLTAGVVDRMTLHGPPGTALLAGGDAVAAGGASESTDGDPAADGDTPTVTLYDADTSAGDVSRLDESVVAFGPPDTAWGVSTLAVAATVVPPWFDALRRFGGLPATVGLLFASGVAVLVGWAGGRDWEPTTVGRRFTVLTGVVTVPVVAVVVGGSLPTGLLAALGPYAVVGVTAWRRPTAFRSVSGATGVTAAAAFVTFVIAVVWSGDPVGAVQTVARVAPVALAPAIGAARRRLRAAAVGVVGALVAVASLFGPDIGGLAVVVATVLVAFGLLLAVPPAVVARAATPRRRDGPS